MKRYSHRVFGKRGKKAAKKNENEDEDEDDDDEEEQ